MENLKITEQQATEELNKKYDESVEILNDQDKMDDFLNKMEEKVKDIPLVGNKLSNVPVFIQLIKDFTTKKYSIIPVGIVIAIISSLLYVLLPIDLISDYLPIIGYIDDAAVVGACLKLVDSDVKKYIEWKEENKDKIEIL